MLHTPVNLIVLGIPDYFDIIKNPIDFSTIKKSLIIANIQTVENSVM